MKKILPFIVFAAGAVLMTSCGKTYICTCTYTDAYGTHTQEGANMKGVSKSTAESTCKDVEADMKTIAGYSAVSCHM